MDDSRLHRNTRQLLGAAVPDEPERNPDYRMVVTERGISVDYGERGYTTEAATDDARYILFKVLPPLLGRFLEKNEKYTRAQTGHDLGAKGVIPDINRKSAVIIDRFWFGAPTFDEDSDEVIDDLIGHLLLLRAKTREW